MEEVLRSIHFLSGLFVWALWRPSCLRIVGREVAVRASAESLGVVTGQKEDGKFPETHREAVDIQAYRQCLMLCRSGVQSGGQHGGRHSA